MDVSRKIYNEVLYFSINQNYNCIAVGLKNGFKIFSTEPFQLYYEKTISIVEMLYTSNLILLVSLYDFGNFSPRKVIIWSTSENSIISSSLTFQSEINIVKINKNRIIVCDRNYMKIYDSSNLKLIQTVDIGYVLLGKLVLSSFSESNNYVCFTSQCDQRLIRVYDLFLQYFKESIVAHKSPVLKLSLNYKGDLIASCSCKGTIIRVFSLPKGEKLFTFKRGLSSAFIFSINFSLDSTSLIATSDSGTLHIFDLNKELTSGSNTISKYLVNLFFSVTTNIIPRELKDYLFTKKSILSTTEDIIMMSNIVSFNSKTNKEAFCFTSDGTFCLFNNDYERMIVKKVYQCNMKDISLIE